jgi:hypothetical protein
MTVLARCESDNLDPIAVEIDLAWRDPTVRMRDGSAAGMTGGITAGDTGKAPVVIGTVTLLAGLEPISKNPGPMEVVVAG